MHIQQSGRLRIIRRFKNFNSIDPSRARIKVIQVIPPRALRRGKRNVFYVAHLFAPILQSNSSEVRPYAQACESVRTLCAMHYRFYALYNI